ncbi:response regulator [Paenibacillus thermotolerans]|uniref:response regulator n=1 Tax=Paenibacillus thermotolerans TaxID=3027807 RepID=UPI002367F80F|nr:MULTISPECIES: response regulator [unclassified Paenibacillus]
MLRFYLVEDDPAVRKMVSRIIAESGLGDVIGEAADGWSASYEAVRKADVVVIDLLMPGRDGIETVKSLREEGYGGRFIMVSQVENKQMVGEAYQQGIDTFIQKPINRLEVHAVLKRVADHLLLEKSLQTIRHSLSVFDLQGAEEPMRQGVGLQERSVERQARSLLLQLGIAGEAGASDLIDIVNWLTEQERDGRELAELPPLKEIYEQVVRINRGDREDGLQKDARAMEQRVRRLASHTLTSLSSLGLNDYANPTFEYYASRLFDFQEVRLRMRELEGGGKTTSAKLNIRKFLYVFYMEARSVKS